MLCIEAGFVNNAIAARADYALGINTEYSDNQNLSADNELSDIKMSFLSGLSFHENTASIQSDLRALAEYNKYKNGTFEDEVVLNLSTENIWTIRPSSFFWVLEDYFSQTENDVLLNETPDNLINTNVFSTGPDIYFRIDPVNKVAINMRASSYNFEDNDTDSKRGSLRLGWIYNVHSSLDVSINTEFQDVSYEEIDDSDYSSQDYFISINSEYSRSIFHLDFGTSFIHRDTREDFDANLLRMTWVNQFRSQSFFTLDVSSQITDSGLDLQMSSSSEQEFDRTGTQISGDIYKANNIEAIYHIANGYRSLDFTLGFRDEDFEEVEQDRILKRFGFNFSYNYFTRVLISTLLQYEKVDNTDIQQLDEQITAGVSFDYRMSRNFTFRTEVTSIKNTSNVSTSEYDENRLLFSFNYSGNPQSYR